jgi:hypothetical protein
MGRIDEIVAVLVDQQGSPLVFRWREKDFQVRSRPVRWFARADWWLGERAHRGIGAGIIEVEMWRFLATADEKVTSFELLHNTASNSWKIIRRFE